jgi:predicted metalloprotease with PDZ domain
MPDIEIHLGMSEPWTHYFDVQMIVSGLRRESLDFIMPVWTPGSYLVREFSRNVQEFSAADSSGKKLEWERINKNTWRVHSENTSKVTIEYRVYAFEISVRTSFVNDSHGYVNGASVFMYLDGHLANPYRLTVKPLATWSQISTGLDRVQGQTHSFLAPDFDTLVDSPIEIGNQKVIEFKVRNIPHYISICGDGNLDPEKVKTDVQKIVETAAEIVGEIPYKHYTFLLQLLPEGSGGLEHLNSTSIQVSRWSFKPEESYRKFLGLVAHEYFHVWNVKRIRPRGLGPFDYTRENYTRLLWVSEGFTSYYGDCIVRWADLMTPDQFLEQLSKTIQSVQETPGRLVESVADASFDAWIKYYRRDEHSPNASISYYSKGELIGLVMDLEIRHSTGRVRSLDDVMRLLYERYRRDPKEGFTEDEFRKTCQEVAGHSLTEIFDHYAYGTSEIDFPRFLEYAGLKFADPKKEERKGYLGLTTRASEGKIMIAGIIAGTPAYEQGLSANDELIAVDGFRVSPDTFAARIEEKLPGTRVEITVSRAAKLQIVPVVLGEKKTPEYKIVRISNPSPEQKTLYESWLRSAWNSQ